MVAAIYPTHALSAGISAVFIVEREMNLIVNSLFRREWLAGLILGAAVVVNSVKRIKTNEKLI